MSDEVVIKEIKETPDVADTPFAMAVLNDKGEIAMYGFYDKDVAREMSHIPLYTKPRAQPLSDEEIESIYYKDFNFEDADMIKFARAIEERHGIK